MLKPTLKSQCSTFLVLLFSAPCFSNASRLLLPLFALFMSQMFQDIGTETLYGW